MKSLRTQPSVFPDLVSGIEANSFIAKSDLLHIYYNWGIVSTLF